MSKDRHDTEPDEPPIRFTDNRKIFRDAFAGEAPSSPAGAGPEGESAAEKPAATDENAQLLEERTRDLQRLSAEYANYRKRADRERLAAGEIAVGRALVELLPVVDDLDRARAHGDLSGALKAVADKLDAAFGKLGLVGFGEVGDPFDPALHEAVMHDESDTVAVPTATTVMRRGYTHGERLLRPAMVGVTDPLHPAAGEPAATNEANATEADAADATTAGPTADTAAEGTQPPPENT